MLPPSGLPWRPCTNRFQWRVSGLGECQMEYVTSSESREEREMGEGRACKVSAYQQPNGGLARVGDRSEGIQYSHSSENTALEMSQFYLWCQLQGSPSAITSHEVM